ncbi:MAG: hypothetical protein HOM69_03180 [Gammaproteobacteria bacterium]|jgi:hypothetical protein|nr:hypothetical protein [Gammaproteobacteria bacterium]MBT5052208.1 hypothetical protein [Gammaproteobacteria bacterium]
MAARQKVLVLYLATSALDTPVIGWAKYDGFGDSQPMTGDEDIPPYKTGVDALRDGWRLIQASPLVSHASGEEFRTDYLKYEFFFEQWQSIETRL